MLKAINVKYFLVVLIFTLNVLVDASEPIQYEYEFVKGKMKYVVNIPEGFKLANGGALTTNSMMGEHIPENEVLTNWSEMMTMILVKQVNNPMSIMKRMLDGFKKSDPNSQIDLNTITENGVPVIYAQVDHVSNIPGMPKSKDKNEIVDIKMVCNSENLWVLQYAVRYDVKKTTEEQKEAIKAKLKNELAKSKVVLK